MSSHSSLVVAPACSDADVQRACDLMGEAADWLADRGWPLWDRKALIPANVRPPADEGTLFLARLAGQPVGTFVLFFEDPDFWPEALPGEALYMHKLAVRRSVAGTGLGHRLLEYADAVARAAGLPLLRLDCASRPKLRAFYESAGFRHHSDFTFGSLDVCRYQRATEALA